MRIPSQLRFAAFALALGAPAAGCSNPCKTLAARVCDEFAGDDDELCATWTERIHLASEETCKQALEQLARVR